MDTDCNHPSGFDADGCCHDCGHNAVALDVPLLGERIA